MIKRDKRLEAVCENIRSGIPVGVAEAIEAIEYHEARRESSLWERFKATVRNAVTVDAAQEGE